MSSKQLFQCIRRGVYALVRANGTGPVTHLDIQAVTFSLVNDDQYQATITGRICDAPVPTTHVRCDFTVEKSGVRCDLTKGHKGRCAFVSSKTPRAKRTRK